MARAVKAVIEISGRVAGSLPASMRQLGSEIGKLTAAQAKDTAAARQLREERAKLGRGTQQYAALSQRLAAVQGRIDYRTDKIAELAAAQRGATRNTGRLSGRMEGLGKSIGTVTPRVGGMAGSLTGLLGRLGPVGIGVGALAGGVLALGAALNKSGKEAAQLLQDAAITGVDVENYQRAAGIFDSVTESTAEARREVAGLARLINNSRLALGGGIGVDVDQNLLTALSLGRGPDIRQFLELDINRQTLALLESLGNVANQNPALAESLARQFGTNFQELFVRLQTGNVTTEQIEADIARQIVVQETELETRKAIAENIEGVHDILERIRNGLFAAVIPALGHLLSGIDTLAGPGSQIDDEFEEALKSYGSEERARAAAERQRAQGERNFLAQPQRNSLEGATGTPDSALPAPPPRSRVADVLGLLVGAGSPAGQLVAPAIRRAGGDIDLDQRVLSALAQIGRFLSPLTPRRLGGTVLAGETTLVGEDGPEIAKFPAGTEILPQAAARPASPSPTGVLAAPQAAARPASPSPTGVLAAPQITYVNETYNIEGVTDVERALEVAERRRVERNLARIGG